MPACQEAQAEAQVEVACTPCPAGACRARGSTGKVDCGVAGARDKIISSPTGKAAQLAIGPGSLWQG